jgi:opacity protein-like surface antigen
MNKSLRILIPSLAIFVSMILPVNAQEKERKYRFEFFGGVNIPLYKDFEIGQPQSTGIIQARNKFSPGGQAGVRFGVDGARHWGQDYAYSYGYNAENLTTSAGDFSFITQFHQASSNLLFYPVSLDRGNFFPYLTAGLGATFVVVSHDTITEAINAGIGPLKSETVFAFNAGAGLRFRLSKRVGLRLDGRDYISRALRYGIPKSSQNPLETVLPVDGPFHQFAGTVAFVIHF